MKAKYVYSEEWEKEQESKVKIEDKLISQTLENLREVAKFVDLRSFNIDIDFEISSMSFEMNIPKGTKMTYTWVGNNIQDIEKEIKYYLGGSYTGAPGSSFQETNVSAYNKGDVINVKIYQRWGLDI